MIISMTVTVKNKFKTEKLLFGNESDSTPILSKDIISYIENGLLIALTASFILTKYVPFLSDNKIVKVYLNIYSAIFVAIQSFLKAYNLYNNVKNEDNVISTGNIVKTLAFTGAFLVAMLGVVPLNIKNDATLSQMMTAVGLSVFPYSFADFIVSENVRFVDLIANGIYALLLSSGIVSWYFGKNMMGVCAFTALIVKSLHGLFMKESRYFDKKLLTRENIVTLIFAGLSVLAMVACYYKGIELELPTLESLLNLKAGLKTE